MKFQARGAQSALPHQPFTEYPEGSTNFHCPSRTLYTFIIHSVLSRLFKFSALIAQISVLYVKTMNEWIKSLFTK